MKITSELAKFITMTLFEPCYGSFILSEVLLEQTYQ